MFKFIFNKWNQTVDPPREGSLSHFETVKRKLCQCDVVLVEGRKRVSGIIRRLTGSSWTHSALYIGKLHEVDDVDIQAIVSRNYDGDPGDQPLIIESLMDKGTTVSRLDKYNTEHLRICRPAHLSLKDGQRVIRYAASCLGFEYDKRHIFDLARYFGFYCLPRKMASSLFRRDKSGTSKTVCSTMIANAFAYVKFPILPLLKLSDGQHQVFRRNMKLCTPRDFDHSPYFEIIKYPFFDLRRKGYKSLPWEGPIELSKEEMKLYHEPTKTTNAWRPNRSKQRLKTKPGPRQPRTSLTSSPVNRSVLFAGHGCVSPARTLSFSTKPLTQKTLLEPLIRI